MGSVLLAVVLGPPMIRDWMFVLTAPGVGALDMLDWHFGQVALWLALALLSTIPVACFLMAKLRLDKTIYLVCLVSVMCFLGAFIYEVVIGLPGALPGMVGCCNLEAGDAGGLTLMDGNLTPHGWDSAARRALVAGAVASLTTMAFSFAGPGRRRNPSIRAEPDR